MFAAILTHSGKRDASIVLDHLEHLIQIGGEDIAAIGTDYDGAISAPTDLQTITELPTLVQGMMDRQWSLDRIQKVLGRNFLRILQEWYSTQTLTQSLQPINIGAVHSNLDPRTLQKALKCGL